MYLQKCQNDTASKAEKRTADPGGLVLAVGGIAIAKTVFACEGMTLHAPQCQ